MDSERAFKTLALTEVNTHILEAARDSVTHAEEWEFFCECGHRDCHEHVLLTVDAYSDLHDRGGVVLAHGHSVSQVERARRLVDDAKALQAEAKQQIARAGKSRLHRANP